MNDSERDQQLQALLPWFVNGTLDDDDALQVEALLQRSEDAAQEEALLRQLQAAVRSEEAVTAPTELSWRRFQQSLPDKPAQTAAKFSFPWPKIASVAAVMIIAVQFTLLVNLPRPADVELLGSEGSRQQSAINHLYLKVVFSDQATWQGIQTLLASVDGEVVAGPSAIGVVVIRFPRVAEQSSLLRQLAASPLVEHVQVVADD